MEKLLMMSMNGSILILLVVVVRWLFYDRLPKRIIHFLWGIALAGLVLPITIQLQTKQNLSPLPLKEVKSLQQTLYEPAKRVILTPAAAAVQNPSLLTVENALLLVYLLGIIIFSIILIHDYRKIRQIVEEALPIQDVLTEYWCNEAQRCLSRKLRLVRSDRIHSPITFGVLFPKIIVPSGFQLSERGMEELILEHELMHIRRWDVLRKLLMLLVVWLHWFNPLVWLMYFLYSRDIEVTCDELVLKKQGLENCQRYAQALLEWNTKKHPNLYLEKGFSKYSLKRRIFAVMKITQKKSWIYGTFVSVLLLLVFLVLVSKPGVASSGVAGQPQRLSAPASVDLPTTETDLNQLLESERSRIHESIQHTNKYAQKNPSRASSFIFIEIDKRLLAEEKLNELEIQQRKVKEQLATYSDESFYNEGSLREEVSQLLEEETRLYEEYNKITEESVPEVIRREIDGSIRPALVYAKAGEDVMSPELGNQLDREFMEAYQDNYDDGLTQNNLVVQLLDENNHQIGSKILYYQGEPGTAYSFALEEIPGYTPNMYGRLEGVFGTEIEWCIVFYKKSE